MFKDLMKSLRFKSSFDAAAPLLQAHLESVQQMLNDFVVRDPLVDENVARRISQLPAESVSRLLTSPYLCELLMILKERADADLEKVRRQILQAIIAEIRLNAPQFEHSLKPKWTIDGDFVLDDEVRAQFPAVTTKCGIRVNYQSYVHNTGKAGIGGYDHATALKHVERLETAKALVAQASPPALSLVDNFTTTIQVRYNNVRTNIVNSSAHTSIGLIRCDNFHQLHTDLPEIVDMMVHESIHQYLHVFEEQVCPFVDLARTPSDLFDVRKYPSPWSGNLLDLRSYTHAILVWYGLWHFWMQYRDAHVEHDEITAKQIQEKIDEAAFGFTNSVSVMDNLGKARQYLNAEYALWVNEIQRELTGENAKAV